MNNPLISIITVSFNAVSTIEKTILSVINQTYPNIEYIIIDGGSTDGSVDVIKKYSDKITYWISEPDKGIYDAMNKGIAIATGEWINFMNAGDILYNIPKELLNKKNSHYIALSYPVEENNKYIEYPSYSWKIRLRNTLPHQGLFYNINLCKPLFNTKYKIYSDYDLNLKFYNTRQSILLLNKVVAFHDMNGISNNKKYANELFQVIKDNCGIFFVIISYLYFKFNAIKRLFSI